MNWPPQNCVVVPVDLSFNAYPAIDIALRLARTPSRVHIIHAVRPLHWVGEDFLWQGKTDGPRRDLAEDALVKSLAAHRVLGVRYSVRVGPPAEVIVAVSKELGAQLIVMPSHGRRGIRRVLLGSVTEGVLRMADIPVLVLRADEEQRVESRIGRLGELPAT